MGIVCGTFLFPTEHGVAEAAAEQGRLYNEAVSTKGHGLGDPHLYIMDSIIDLLSKMDEAPQPLVAMLSTYAAWSVTQRSEHVRMCRVVKLLSKWASDMVSG